MLSIVFNSLQLIATVSLTAVLILQVRAFRRWIKIIDEMEATIGTIQSTIELHQGQLNLLRIWVSNMAGTSLQPPVN